MAAVRLIKASKQVSIRRWELEDAKEWFGVSQDDGLNLYSYTGYRQRSVEEARSFIRSKDLEFEEAGLGLFPIVSNGSGEILGICGLRTTRLEERGSDLIELIYRLARSQWNKGYGTQAAAALLGHAFDDLELPQVFAYIETENLASRRVLEKIGMRLRGWVLYQGVNVEEFSSSMGE